MRTIGRADAGASASVLRPSAAAPTPTATSCAKSRRLIGIVRSLYSRAEPDRPTPRLMRALRHRNYRLFFSGQTVSLIGTWITRIATSWLVYRLTKSELLLGVVSFA